MLKGPQADAATLNRTNANAAYAEAPQHFRTICLRPVAVKVMTTSTFLPQYLHFWPAAFAS